MGQPTFEEILLVAVFIGRTGSPGRLSWQQDVISGRLILDPVNRMISEWNSPGESVGQLTFFHTNRMMSREMKNGESPELTIDSNRYMGRIGLLQSPIFTGRLIG